MLYLSRYQYLRITPRTAVGHLAKGDLSAARACPMIPPIRSEKSRQAIGACAEGNTMARGGRADAPLWHRGYSDRNNEWARLRRGEPRMNLRQVHARYGDGILAFVFVGVWALAIIFVACRPFDLQSKVVEIF